MRGAVRFAVLLALEVAILGRGVYVDAVSCGVTGVTYGLSFLTSNPTCTRLLGSLRVLSGAQTDMQAASALLRIDGDLDVDSTVFQTSMSGLDSLAYVGGDVTLQVLVMPLCVCVCCIATLIALCVCIQDNPALANISVPAK